MKTITTVFISIIVLLSFTNELLSVSDNNEFISCSNKIEMNEANRSHYVRRGCCSHHGGVCGCAASGKQLCCDGSESKSCWCRY